MVRESDKPYNPYPIYAYTDSVYAKKILQALHEVFLEEKSNFWIELSP